MYRQTYVFEEGSKKQQDKFLIQNNNTLRNRFVAQLLLFLVIETQQIKIMRFTSNNFCELNSQGP